MPLFPHVHPEHLTLTAECERFAMLTPSGNVSLLTLCWPNAQNA
jgi:hypothetical protein